MSPRALLRFLPACAAGLLAGWMVSRWMPQPSAQADGSLAPAPDALPASPQIPSWSAVLAARTAGFPPGDPAHPSAELDRVGRAFIHSPVRAEFFKEDYLQSLPAAALVSLLEKGPELTETQYMTAFGRLAELDPALAFETAGRFSRTHHLDFLKNTVCQAWLRRDAGAALEAVKNLPQGSERSGWTWALAQAWASLDPAAAARNLRALAALDLSRGDALMPHLASTIVTGWVEKDVAAARQWVDGLDDPALRDKLQIPLLTKQAETDPAAAVAAVFQRKDITGTERAVIGIWHRLYDRDAPAAMAALAKLPPDHPVWRQADSMAFDIFVSGGPGLADKIPDLAAQLPEGPARDRFLAGFVHAGASNDIPMALKILPLVGEGREREQAVGSLTELWMRKDPVKTSEWLATLPADSDSRNSGVARFAENLAPDDPERAAQWAATIPDSYWQKEGVLKTVMEKWSLKDPEAAARWQAGTPARPPAMP